MRSLGFAFLIVLASPAMGQTAPTTVPANPRAAFDFLLGAWQVQPSDGTAPRSDIYYRFSKPAETPVIVGDWKFDRGVAGKPDVAVGNITAATTTPRRPGRSIMSAIARRRLGPAY